MKHWPLFGLTLRTPRLELRLPTLSELDALADVALGGVHDPAEMPFTHPWTDQPSERMGPALVQFNLNAIAAWRPDDWNLLLVVFRDGEPIGHQAVQARDFGVVREISSGSWLGLPFQGRGYGTEMRAAILHLAFAGLDALAARTGAHPDNPRSLGVTRKLGYAPNGVSFTSVRGVRVEESHFRMDRPAWEAHRTVAVELDGLEPCLPYFGAEK